MLAVTCRSEPCTARLGAKSTVPKRGRVKAKTFTFSSAKVTLKKGVKRTVRLKLSKSARLAILRALRARKTVSATLTATLSDTAGNTRTLKRTVRFRR